MRLLFFALIFAVSVSAFAKNAGTIKYAENELNIVDTYTIYNEKINELTVYFLSCKYRKELIVDWKSEYGFLKCFPISEKQYFSSPGASLTIKLSANNKVGRVIFSTTKFGESDSHSYSGFSKSWFRNAPIKDLEFYRKNKIKFLVNFKIPNKGLIVNLSINTNINETIK